MSSTRPPQPNAAFATLRSFVRDRAPAERCELCNAALAIGHAHMLDTSTRTVTCACDPCAILFTSDAATKYRRVPRRIRFLPSFVLSDGQWDALMIPINLAFFFHSTPAGRVVALYPSPAGPTESLLALDAWDEIVAENPVVGRMDPDVEALLVNRIGSSRGAAPAEYYVAPIDECFKLVGLIRSRWRGLSGGAEVWEEIGRFFGELKARATTYEEPPRA